MIKLNTDFIFSTNLYRYHNVLKCIQSDFEILLTKLFKCLIMQDWSVLRLGTCPKQWHTEVGVTPYWRTFC